MSWSQTKVTSKFLKDLLKGAHKELKLNEAPEAWNITQIWAAVVGDKIAALTQVKSFNQGILMIKVESASLSQLLTTTEKSKILAKIRKNYPYLNVKNLLFRSG